MEAIFAFTDEACNERGIDLDNKPICCITNSTYDEFDQEITYLMDSYDGRKFAAFEHEIIPIEEG